MNEPKTFIKVHKNYGHCELSVTLPTVINRKEQIQEVMLELSAMLDGVSIAMPTGSDVTPLPTAQDVLAEESQAVTEKVEKEVVEKEEEEGQREEAEKALASTAKKTSKKKTSKKKTTKKTAKPTLSNFTKDEVIKASQVIVTSTILNQKGEEFYGKMTDEEFDQQVEANLTTVLKGKAVADLSEEEAQVLLNALKNHSGYDLEIAKRSQ